MDAGVSARQTARRPGPSNLGQRFNVPVIILQGAYDLYTPWATAKAWFDGIEAPRKTFITLRRSSHTAFLEEPRGGSDGTDP